MRAFALATLLLASSEAAALAQANRPVGAMTSGRASKCYVCGTAASASGLVNGVNLSWCAGHARNPVRGYQGRGAGVLSLPSRAGNAASGVQTPRARVGAAPVRTSKAPAPGRATGADAARRFQVQPSERARTQPAETPADRTSTGAR